jgi:hypothetical protein
MFSEYGCGTDHYKCDQGVDFIKTLVLSPFSGIAGCAMNWDWQSTDETFLWHHMGPVNELMSGIKLDEEYWIEGTPIVSTNKAVEVLYLRNFVENNYRVVGAVSNRTYNYYTQAIGSPCDTIISGGEIDNDEIYQNMMAYISTVGTQVLVIPDMGDEIEYKINWYNALTGEPIDTVNEVSLENGWLPLHFPFLSGNASKPILFFEVYRANQSTFKLSSNEVSSNNVKVIQSLHTNDTTHAITVLTHWETMKDSMNT